MEPSYNAHPVDELEPVMPRQDAIAELAEQLAFAFEWMLDAGDTAAVTLRCYVAAHHFCPSYIRHETLRATGDRLRVSRQAVSKLSSELRDLLGVRPSHARSDGDRVSYQQSHL